MIDAAFDAARALMPHAENAQAPAPGTAVARGVIDRRDQADDLARTDIENPRHCFGANCQSILAAARWLSSRALAVAPLAARGIG